jgi:hypothetical protein
MTKRVAPSVPKLYIVPSFGPDLLSTEDIKEHIESGDINQGCVVYELGEKLVVNVTTKVELIHYKEK